jgi:hypothetical protein
MQHWREQYLGLAEFLPAIASAEVDQFFTLSREELAAVESRRGPLNRLSVGLQIGFLRMAGRILNSCQIVPAAVLAHLGRQLNLTPPQLASIRGLYRRKRTLFDHQHVAMMTLGFRHLSDHAERGLTAHLRRAAEGTFSADALIRAARVWLYEHGYVLPGDKRVALLVRAALRHAEDALSRRIAAQFSAETVAICVKNLIAMKQDEAEMVLEWLRALHRIERGDATSPIISSDHGCCVSSVPAMATGRTSRRRVSITMPKRCCVMPKRCCVGDLRRCGDCGSRAGPWRWRVFYAGSCCG